MPRLLVVVVAVAIVAVTGCVPLPSKHATHPGQTWAQAGSPVLFKWSERETTSRMWGMDIGTHDDIGFSTSESTDTDRTWITATDPRTNTHTQLSAVRAKVFPFYWDATRGVLWVKDKDRGVLGLTAKDPIHAPGGIDYHVSDLPAPWLFGHDRRTTYIFNAQTNTTFALQSPRGGLGAPHLDGSTLRFVRVDEVDGVVAIAQVVVDWSGPQPVRRPDILWTTPALSADAGRRDAFTVMPDGRHFVEVVTTGTSNVYVYDMVGGGPVTTLPIDRLDGRRTTIEPLAGDVVFVSTVTNSCDKGTMVAIARKRTRAVDDDVCIRSIGGHAGGRYVRVGEHDSYVDDSLGLVETGVSLDTALAIDATTFVYAHPDADSPRGLVIDKVDLAAATTTRLGTHANPDDKLVGIYDETLMFLGSANTLVTQRLGEPADAKTSREPASIALPAVVTDGPDGQALAYETADIGNEVDRTKFWFGGLGGVTTTGNAAIDATMGLQRFWTDHIALSANLVLRGESRVTFSSRTSAAASASRRSPRARARAGGWAATSGSRRAGRATRRS